MYITALLTVLLVYSVGTTTAVVEGDIDCSTGLACFPWAGEESHVPCVRGRRMNLRFMLDVADENVKSAEPVKSNAFYGFCPVVDKLQIFTLTNAPFLASVFDNAGTLSLTNTMERKYLSIYGFGASNSTNYPQKNFSAGAVLVAVNGTALCGSNRSVALVDTLVLDIGLHKGLFNYIGARAASIRPDTGNSNSNSGSGKNTKSPVTPIPEVVVQPAMVGFRPTCSANDECLFDTGSVCVGLEVGKKNCAKCYDSAEDIRDKAQLRVWASYYGTDQRGRPLLSGGMNPLNFRGLAGSGFFRDIRKTLDSLIRGSANRN
ncbi:hypothetical protein LSM04_000778 [Trypanosoma melophagium]|uniref:uncharacterized protein n=1 Tax=Trypanosoma melophagium TaxID=715481 RepID=UPI00351A8071|nr:hypothetical protein LSM04_000778 [Trypanosoma melophagium]